MKVEVNPDSVRQEARTARQANKIIGVIPTMGALHAGHVSLMEAAVAQCDFVMTTIFVNPTQFAADEDLTKYPRTLQTDLERCQNAGVDLVFTPNVNDMYHPDAATVVRVSGLTDVLEGSCRPTHFDGVTTIVAKLFNITDPDKAYFGQKDFQQQLIIRQMTRDLNFGLDIITCPIVRDPDGLAMSSRNRYLSTDERESALAIPQSLKLAAQSAEKGISRDEILAQMLASLSKAANLEVDYATIVNPTSLNPTFEEQSSPAIALIAARVGTTRLIDNAYLRFPVAT